MRTPLIAGNWKMHTTVNQGAEFVIRLRELIKGVTDVEIVIAPPFPSLHHISHLIADSPIRLSAQNLFWEEKGAYTGEVSAEMLKAAGCSYALIGHSERRAVFKETDELVNKKLLAALRHDLKPIVCVGETLEQKDAGKTLDVVRSQVRNGLAGISGSAVRDITIAYEPVWAIGTGRNATPQEAEDVHNGLRELFFEMFDIESARDLRVIYGGSVKPENIDGLMAQPNIDGALVGGASLDAAQFARIVRFKPA